MKQIEKNISDVKVEEYYNKLEKMEVRYSRFFHDFSGLGKEINAWIIDQDINTQKKLIKDVLMSYYNPEEEKFISVPFVILLLLKHLIYDVCNIDILQIFEELGLPDGIEVPVDYITPFYLDFVDETYNINKYNIKSFLLDD